MNKTTRYIAIQKSPDLPLIAFAVSKFDARIVGAEIDPRNPRTVIFSIEIDQITLPKIAADFEGDGVVCARRYSQELRFLRGVVRKALTKSEATQ